MVAIQQFTDPTLEKMLEICASQKEKKRGYLGASLIGSNCPRFIWYTYKGIDGRPTGAETLFAFEDGHRTESLTIERLRRVPGIEIWDKDDSGVQYGFSDFNGKFRGHFDGVIRGIYQAPKTAHILEIKCCAEKKFNEFVSAVAKYGEKGALKQWNESYYVQAQLYMHYSNLTRHYLVVAKAGGRGYFSCRTEYEKETALQYIERAEKIINAKEPPHRINEKRDYYLCRWCPFSEVCHG